MSHGLTCVGVAAEQAAHGAALCEHDVAHARAIHYSTEKGKGMRRRGHKGQRVWRQP